MTERETWEQQLGTHHIPLLMTVADPLQKLLVQLTYTTALRIDEILALKWGDLRHEAGLLRVKAPVEGDDNRTAPRSAKARSVHVPDDLMRLIEKHFENLVQRNGPVPGRGDYMFGNNGKRFTCPDFLTNIVEPLFRAARDHQLAYPNELPALPQTLGWHNLRHVFISEQRRADP